MTGVSIVLPPDDCERIIAHCTRIGVPFAKLLAHEIKANTSYFAEIAQAQRTGGDMDVIIGRCAMEAANAICQRLRVAEAISEAIGDASPARSDLC